MNNSTDQLHRELNLGDYPVLASLRLDCEDFAAIADQGSISQDHRGDRTYHKLRYRRDGRQRVRYIGDAARAIAVEAELQVLQHDLRLRRHISELARSVTSKLRTAREQLGPLVESHGYHFHGHALRKRRKNTN